MALFTGLGIVWFKENIKQELDISFSYYYWILLDPKKYWESINCYLRNLNNFFFENHFYYAFL